MKKAVLLLLFALTVPCMSAVAQKIALGERVPELKVSSWLGGQLPKAAPLTYVEFFHSTNPACITSMERLKTISDKFGAKLHVVVLSQESEEKVTPLLSPFLSPDITVGFDSDGRIFTAFGVSYVPFGVLLDARNRALWLGNSLQLTPELIEKTSR